MNFYQCQDFIQNAKKKSHLIDLSTGDPYVPKSIIDYLKDNLASLSSMEVDKIYSYGDFDGISSFLDTFKNAYEKISGNNLNDYGIMAVPGAQAALCYLQLTFLETKKKLLYPANFEFIGAFTFANEYKFSYDLTDFLTGNFEDDIKCLSKVDWNEIAAIFISQPHNPTSILWSKKRLKQLAEYVLPYNVYIILDETYALPFATLMVNEYRPLLEENIIHIYSFSKVGLAGERVGVVLALKDFIPRLQRLQRKLVIQTPKIGQRLAEGLIEYFCKNIPISQQFGLAYESRLKTSINIFDDYQLINKIVLPPIWGGGPFLWVNFKNFSDEDRLFQKLLNNNLAVTPSSALVVDKSNQQTAAFRIGLGGDFEKTMSGIEIFTKTLLQETI